jgi:hypothetical protein
MATIDSQQPMLSQMVQSLLTLIQAKACGGEPTLVKLNLSTESEFLIEEIAVEADLEVLKFGLEPLCAVKSQWVQEMVNGTQLHVPTVDQ